MEKHLYEYWFLSNSDISYSSKSKLLEYFNDSYHIYEASQKELIESGLMKNTDIDKFINNRSKANLDKLYEQFSCSPFSFITMEDENYPEELRNIFSPPYGFFYAGKIPQLQKTVSIVGARRCSAYGKKMAFELGEALAGRGYTVISGMAKGIDTYSHQGAVEGGGKTVAVLGCGADIVYPPENRLLYEQIVKNGAVISEFPMGLQPMPQNFPQRNRIVSGLARKVIVVEARLKSGSLITADFALEQGRDVYAVPGRVGDSLSEGCNKLITQGAGIIMSVDAFMKELAEFDNEEYVEVKKKDSKGIKLTKEETLVLSSFDYYPISINEVQAKTGIDYFKIIPIVYSLVRQGLIQEVFKNNFIICA